MALDFLIVQESEVCPPRHRPLRLVSGEFGNGDHPPTDRGRSGKQQPEEAAVETGAAPVPGVGWGDDQGSAGPCPGD